MRKTILIVLGLVLGLTGCEDDDIRNADVPSVVINGFSEQFPNAIGVEWDKHEDWYEAEFELENVEHTAILNAEGSILKYKYDISFDALPMAVQTKILSDFDRTKIDDIDLMHYLDNKYYQVEFDDEPDDEKIIFEESGQTTTNIAIW